MIVILSLSMHCGSSSSSDGDVGYVLQPGGATAYTTGSGYTVDFGGAKTGNYAVIYNAEINGVSYVGIAVDDDGDTSDNTFNIKIYFQSSGIPGSITLDNSNCTVKVTNTGTTYTLNDSFTLTITNTGVNNIYSIKTTPDANPITTTGGNLVINEIKAILVSQ